MNDDLTAKLDAIEKAREATDRAAAGCAAVLDAILELLPGHMTSTRAHAAECVERYKAAQSRWYKLVDELSS